MDSFFSELRLAARRLRADRWAAAGAILAAALGAGLNTAVFAVAYGVLLRPLPYADADRLVVINTDTPFVTMREWREGLTSLTSSSAYARENFTVYGAGEPRVASVAIVDDAFFATLGSTAGAGRVFGASDGASAVVVSARFAAQDGDAHAILGRRLTVGEASLTVAGVMPAAFAFPSERTDVWMPAAAAPAIAFDRSQDARRFLLVGRLRETATLAQAREEMARVQARLTPETVRRQREAVRIASVREGLVGSVRPVLLAFAAAAAIVLLIACANVATILVGRTLGRQRELAVRRALGASSRQLFASILSESLLISVAGAALGVAIAVIAVRFFARWAAGIIPRLGDVDLDWTVLGFTVATTALAALVSAAPAFRTARRAAAPSLRLGGWGSSRLDRRSRSALIVVQIALAVVLLAGGALLARTIVGLLRGELGVSAPGTIVTQLLLTTGTSFTAGDRAPLLDDVLRRVRTLPGVTAAGAGSNLPPDNASIEVRVTLAGDAGQQSHMLSMGSATPGYLPAIGARLLDGRDFRDGDDRAGSLVTVVSESVVRTLLPGPASAVGRQLPFALPGLRDRGRPTVIGIVSDIKYRGLESPARPAVYVMWSHFPAGQTFLAVRTEESSAKMANTLRAILRERDARIPLMPVRTLEEVVERSVADRRLRALLGGSVALLAFAVAMVGLAGSLMRIVFERREELAIRAALGASPARAVRTIVREGILLAGIGVAVGCVAALAMGRALATLLHGVSPHDPATLAGVAVFVGGASLLASYIPARRAARIDPLTLLRAE